MEISPNDADHDHEDDHEDDHGEVVVYWRPGCMFCSSLRRALSKAGLPTRDVNIWDEPDGAEVVRQAAGGNETVPTVAVGGQLLVNPPAQVVLALAERDGIEREAPPEGGALSRLLRR